MVVQRFSNWFNVYEEKGGQYRAYLLLGCHLRDILPSKPALGIASDLSSTWLEVAEYRELALDKRSAKAQEMNHIKELHPWRYVPN